MSAALPTFEQDDELVACLAHRLQGKRLAVLTGAGCSTESGIPDYRGPETARRARNPIQYREFMSSEHARRRYWTRSLAGWPLMSRAQPNSAHRALAEIEARGLLRGIITQNVDGLHQAAGSHRVIELHGALSRVRCLGCSVVEGREALQERLLALNPNLHVQTPEAAPDGDADLIDVGEGLTVAACLGCGGVLKPDVVFFGENVPRGIVEETYRWVENSEALLVVGTSLTVFSGYRFVRRAHELNKDVVIVNLGPTRGDPLATLKIDGQAGKILPRLAQALLV